MHQTVIIDAQKIINKLKIFFMKKHTLLALIMFSMTMTGMSQIKVTNGGKVGIGNNNPPEQLTVNISGNNKFCLASWFYTYMDQSGECGATSFYPQNSWYLHLGKQNNRIGKIYTDWIHVGTTVITSDENAKENIQPVGSTIEKIKQLSAYSYNLKADNYPQALSVDALSIHTKKQFGFLAQELELEFPELVYPPASEGEPYAVNYNGMIPILLEAIKEQQAQIESLQTIVSECCFKNKSHTVPNDNSDNEEGMMNEIPQGKLYDNVPNPFSLSTEIRFEIPDNATSAQLMICNLNGVELKSYNLTQRGLGSVTIQGSELAAGMYLYTLLINNKIIDTKKMVLTK